MNEAEASAVAVRTFASWLPREQGMAFDAADLGGKAAGLVALPPEWVPPFLVLLAQPPEARTPLGVSSHFPDEQQIRLIHELLELASKATLPPAHLLLRSNSRWEATLATRGQGDTLTLRADPSQVLEAVTRAYAHHHDSILLQVAVEPGVLGHLSNERRVSGRREEWLLEALGSTPTQTKRLKAVGQPTDAPLLASSRPEAEAQLSAVAASLLQRLSGHFHVEWVWDGRRVWIVQADEAPPPALTPANSYLRSRVSASDSATSRPRVLIHFSDARRDVWKKLARAHAFFDLGIPTADVFLLDGHGWALSEREGHDGLLNDLRDLCTSPVIVRTDVTQSSGRDDMFLPVSGASMDPHVILGFMREASLTFASSGLRPQDWALLPAREVSARVSAMVQSYPSGQLIRVDSLWGFPDGLLYLPHDSYFLYPESGRVRERRAYKGRCVLPDARGWRTEIVGPPEDWRSTLNTEEVRQIGGWAAKLANHLEHEVQVMVLARIDGRRGPSAALAFFYTTMTVPKPDEAVRPMVSERPLTTIRSKEDLPPGENECVGGLLLRPQPNLLRDRDFLTSVGRTARQLGVPIYFEGSLLGHAYYLLNSAGASVIPVNQGEPPPERRSYQKLVRDHIPAIIRHAGGLARVRTLSRREARTALAHKLVEEAFEVWSTSAEDELLAELADVLEVVLALAAHTGINEAALRESLEARRRERGGFSELVYLEETATRTLTPGPSTGELPLEIEAPTTARRAYVSAEWREESRGFTLRLPSVPPVENGQAVIEVELDGNAYAVRVRFDQPLVIDVRPKLGRIAPATGQLRLFEMPPFVGETPAKHRNRHNAGDQLPLRGEGVGER